MFETATLSYGSNTKRVWTTAMGFTGQTLLVACALLAPLLSPQVLPRVAAMITLAPPGPLPPLAPPPGDAAVQRSPRVPSQLRPTGLLLPKLIPDRPIVIEEDAPLSLGSALGVSGGMAGGREGGDRNGILDGILTQVAGIIPTVRPPEVKQATTNIAPAPAAPPRITQIRMATPIHKVEPVYPALAKQARVSGTVELLGVLGTDGRIREIKVLRGHPLLVKSAVDAVRQWIFEPTTLNGQAVEVSAPITVNFILNQ